MHIPSHRKHFHFQTILFKNAVLEWIIKHIFFYINIRYFYISRGGVFRIINLFIFDTPGDFQSLITIWPSIITYFANCRSVAFGRKKLDTYDMGANIDTYMLKYWYLQLQTKTCVSFELIKLISIYSLYNLSVPLNFSDNLQLRLSFHYTNRPRKKKNIKLTYKSRATILTSKQIIRLQLIVNWLIYWSLNENQRKIKWWYL